jgi:hypothetical protein
MLGGIWAQVKTIARLEFIKGKTSVDAAELADPRMSSSGPTSAHPLRKLVRG